MLAMLGEGFTLKEISAFLPFTSKTLSYWKKHPPSQYGLDLVWKNLEQINEGDLLATFAESITGAHHPINYQHTGRLRNKVSIPSSVDDKLAWLVGLYLGDGWNTRGRVGFSLMAKDQSRQELIDSVNEIFAMAPSVGRQVEIQ